MPAARIVVQRADSLRSERSDLSQANKRVSFNHDVDVKHIKQQQQQQHQSRSRGSNSSTSSNSVTAVAAALERYDSAVPPPVHPSPHYSVYKQPTSLSEAELAQEAERIIQQVDQISCTVSPNPLLANYETRSLERKAKRNNNQQPDAASQWSRTLPATASTKNQLSNKTNKNVEKNNLVQQQQHQQQQHQQKNENVRLDPIEEIRRDSSAPQTMLVDHRTGQFVQKANRDAATTPPKYDSGIEMDSRPSVNLIVQQLTEEARQRELVRRQYSEELLNDDPLAPRLPALNLIEPDADMGLVHNRNLPFSYTGGSSPTRLSPLRTNGARFASPPPRAEEPPPAPKKDIVYAQVKVSRDRSQSPERNIFRSANGQADKVPARAKLDFSQQTSRRRNYYDDDDDNDEVDDDLDALKAKARFLFGDDGESRRRLDTRNNNNQRAQTTLNNNALNNNNNNSAGLSYKYSTIVKDRSNEKRDQREQHVDTGRNYTTKIVIGGDRPAAAAPAAAATTTRKYSYERDDEIDHGRRRVYQDRSVSPEPRINPASTRIRYEMSPERYPSDYRTLPLPAKKTNQVTSSRLVQEAERGRTVVRNQRPEFNSSRLVQQAATTRYADEYDNDHEPPKPPIRLKKLSRERVEGSPVRASKPAARVGFVPWQADGSESSPERTLHRGSTTLRTKTYRLRSDTPSPERPRLNRWNNEPTPPPPVDEAEFEAAKPEKEEKIRRQRSKFLSVFLGSKVGKSKTAPSAKIVRSPSAAQQVKAQAPPVAKWSADDEADFVRSRPPPAATAPTAKGHTHQSAIRSAQRPIGQRKSAAPPVPVQQQHQQQQQVSNEASRYRMVGKAPPGTNDRRRESTDRTDTSESEDTAHQRFKSMRQKSQSFNNLNYRPAVELAEESDDRRRTSRDEDEAWADKARANRQSRIVHEQIDNARSGRALGDARPYASTNLIHQVGRPADVRRQTSADNEMERPMMKEASRQMRYFGDTDLESQPSQQQQQQQQQRGQSSSRYQPKAKVTRSASTAAPGAVRRGVIQQRSGKQPVSSVNSSESDGSALQSGASAESQRSVYLHATTVADIPNLTPATNNQKQAQLRDARRKAQSREDMSAISGQTGSTLRRTRHISRSYSVLAPWKPRHYRDKFEITYSNQQTPAMMSPPAVLVNNNNNNVDVGKPPRAPRRQEMASDADEANDGYRSGASRSASKPGVSRSSTMPKNTKLMAGWFRKKKQR